MINLESNKEIIPFKTKINFSLGALATGFFSGFPFGSLTLFYEEKLGANHELIGLAWLIFMIWNTVNDPIASFIIDNTRTKIGRRIPYIRFGSFFYGAAFIFCWIPIAQIGDEWGLFWNFLVALFLLDTMYTIVGCCFFSLPNEIAVTSQGRVNIGLFSSAIMVINTVLGFILPMIYLSGDSIGEGFQEMMIILGIIFTLVMFFSSFGIKENMFAQMQEYEPFIEGIKLTFKNKPFWVFMVPAFFFAIVIPLISISFIFYMDYVLKGQNSFLFIIGMLIGIIIGVRFFLKKLPSWKTRKTIIFGLYILSLGFFLILF
ncbi:MAG: MFS transporter, partial [archaeon]|nr:MFS transporter [archaeon]